MKKLKFIYLILKSIILTIIMFNIVPGIFVAIAFFRGKLILPLDWVIPYFTGFSVMVIIAVIYMIIEIMKPDLPY